MKFKFALFHAGLCVQAIAMAQPAPQLIKDIYSGDQHGDPGNFQIVNDRVLFFANDGVNSIELWSTDGTEAGTFLVKNIGEGDDPYCQSTFGCGPESVVMNDVLYFRASDAVHGAEIWRSDGTEAGTYMLKDINLGSGDCSNSVFMNGQYFTILDDVLYFAADGGGDNIELWRSDGTEAGTYIVKDFATGESSVPRYISSIDGYLYFVCTNASDEPELWKSDGTEAGSVLLKQMWVRGFDNDRGFIKFNDKIFFAGDDDASGYNMELWSTDGTPSGTQLFLELNPETDDGSDPREFHVVNDKLLFSARPDNNDVLMVSDGTAAGTVQLQDENGDDFEAEYYHLPGENKLYFQGSNEDGDDGLWVTDGTDAGTSFLLRIESGAFDRSFATVLSGNNIVFRSYDDDNGCSTIFQSNGTEEGTKQTYECETIKNPYGMITYNGNAIVNAETETTGRELYLIEAEFTTALTDTNEEELLKIYPNPVQDILFITADKELNENEFSILNAFGENMYASTLLSANHTIDVSFLPPGMYFLKINSGTSKFIKP